MRYIVNCFCGGHPFMNALLASFSVLVVSFLPAWNRFADYHIFLCVTSKTSPIILYAFLALSGEDHWGKTFKKVHAGVVFLMCKSRQLNIQNYLSSLILYNCQCVSGGINIACLSSNLALNLHSGIAINMDNHHYWSDLISKIDGRRMVL